MARDVLTVWNMALGFVGARAAVQSQTESTREAQHLASIWELMRDSELEDFDWNFLTAHRTLSALSEDAPETWEYVYQYPSDCFKFRYIESPLGRTSEPLPFEIGNGTGGSRVIWADEEDAIGWYSKQVFDPNLWSAKFCEALARKLAVSCAMVEIGSSRDAGQQQQLYERELERAKVLSCNEEQRDGWPDARGVQERI